MVIVWRTYSEEFSECGVGGRVGDVGESTEGCQFWTSGENFASAGEIVCELVEGASLVSRLERERERERGYRAE